MNIIITYFLKIKKKMNIIIYDIIHYKYYTNIKVSLN